METLILTILLLSMVPAIEARVPTIYFVCSGQWLLIPLAVLLNFFGTVVFVSVIDRTSISARVNRFMEKKTGSKRQKIKKWFDKYGNAAMFMVIGLPSTGVGSYSGAFLGRVLGLKGRIFYASILLGIIVSLIPAVLIGLGINVLGVTCPKTF